MNISSLLPDLIDQYITARAERLMLDKQVEQMKEHEELLKKAIIAKYQEQGLTLLGSNLGVVKLTEADEPVAQDWVAVWDYIKENNAFELLHKRLTNTAVKERWETGEEIPGVGKQKVYRLSVSGTK
jgi:hypothetical protein